MRIERLYLLPLMLLSLFCACDRQDLEEYLYSKAMFPVLIDWESKALMSVDDDPDEDLYSASIWLFPTESSTYQGAPLEYKLSN
ncbi:MAG: hypothetical protein SNH64_06670, partial [Rikenellaceae bacterium]